MWPLWCLPFQQTTVGTIQNAHVAAPRPGLLPVSLSGRGGGGVGGTGAEGKGREMKALWPNARVTLTDTQLLCVMSQHSGEAALTRDIRGADPIPFTTAAQLGEPPRDGWV